MIELSRLQELRAEHRAHAYGGCSRCGGVWPCEQSQILDMALEAERLRAEVDELSALLEAMTRPAKSLAQINHEIMMAVHGPGGINEQASALAGTEAKP